jgi:hypothetical protein
LEEGGNAQFADSANSARSDTVLFRRLYALIIFEYGTQAFLALASDAGAFAALGGEDVGVAGVVVAPGEVVLQAAGQHRVVRMV